MLSFPDYTTILGIEIKRFFTGERNYSAQVIHLLFAANRWERRSDLVNWLSKGEVLVINRYTESNLAYGMANGLKLSWLMSLEEGMPKTDLVILLDATPSTVRSRRKERNDRYENDPQLQQRARDFYHMLAEKFEWTVVDAGKGVETVHGAVKEAMTALFARHNQTI
jgi:dTMP kinase